MAKKEKKFVYFRDRAKALGMHDVYELKDKKLPHLAKLEPDNPKSPLNYYKHGDLSVWKFIRANK